MTSAAPPSPRKAALIRLLREAGAFVLPILLWHLNNDPKWIALKPVITAVGKYLRDAYHVTWLPF